MSSCLRRDNYTSRPDYVKSHVVKLLTKGGNNPIYAGENKSVFALQSATRCVSDLGNVLYTTSVEDYLSNEDEISHVIVKDQFLFVVVTNFSTSLSSMLSLIPSEKCHRLSMKWTRNNLIRIKNNLVSERAVDIIEHHLDNDVNIVRVAIIIKENGQCNFYTFSESYMGASNLANILRQTNAIPVRPMSQFIINDEVKYIMVDDFRSLSGIEPVNCLDFSYRLFNFNTYNVLKKSLKLHQGEPITIDLSNILIYKFSWIDILVRALGLQPEFSEFWNF